MGPTQELAEFAARLRYEDLPAEVVEKAKWAVGDALGVGLCASGLEWSRIVADHASTVGGGTVASATVWGRGFETSAPMAALANGTAVHGIEMDDRSFDLNVHNGAATVPAALAMAEALGVGGRELLVAVVCGYEVAYRVARATLKGITNHYPNAIKTVFGATTAAARVAGLDAEAVSDALGIAGSMASGLWEFKHDPDGTMVKRVQGGGWPAQSGVTAALLARRGLTGPGTILEGEDGLCRSFATAREPDLDALTRDLGRGFQISRWETKNYATWGVGQSSLDAVMQLRSEHSVRGEDIERLLIECSTKTRANALTRRPSSIMAAQYHLLFIVAACFYYDLTDPSVWTEDILGDERICDLMDRIEVALDPEIERIYEETNDHGGVRMVATLEDGGQRRAHVRHAKGTPDNPLTSEELQRKLRTLSARALTVEQVEHLSAWVSDLDALAPPVDLAWLH